MQTRRTFLGVLAGAIPVASLAHRLHNDGKTLAEIRVAIEKEFGG